MHHLDTLSEANVLCVPAKYTVERILADEHHVVAVCRVGDEARQWFMSVFDLATCNQIGGDNTSARGVNSARFSLPERFFDFDMHA